MEKEISAFDQLIAHNIRPSVQRLAVMEYLLTYRSHPSVEEIYAALHPTIPTLSKTTIYNTLNLFLEYGAVQALTIDEKQVRYDADCTDHAHFRCTKCGKLYDFPQPTFNDNNIVSSGFKIDRCHVYLSGMCKECQLGKSEE